MKLKVNDKVYLQRYEVEFLLQEFHNFNFPDSIMREIRENKRPFLFDRVKKHDGSFHNIFKNPENVQWLMEQDWIVDYDRYKNNSIPQLQNICNDLNFDRISELEDFTSKPVFYRVEHDSEQSERLIKSSHKISSLETMIKYLNRSMPFFFPEEIAHYAVIPTTPQQRPGFFAQLLSYGAQ